MALMDVGRDPHLAGSLRLPTLAISLRENPYGMYLYTEDIHVPTSLGSRS
jgi:hypothetical protein